MRISEFFKSNKGTWTLTAIFIVLLMAIIIYPEFWAGSDPAINAEVEKVNSDDAQLNDESTINNSNNEQTPTLAGDNQPDDGESRPSDPDTIVDPDATAANAAPPTWVEPLSGEIGRAYGFSYDPTYNDYRFQHGFDLMAEPGTAVYAAASGTVVISREDGFWGGIVTIDHGGGWKSIYRCLTPDVVYGDTPEGGEIIGYIQETTTAEGGQEAHLHFELYLNDEEVDPAEWI